MWLFDLLKLPGNIAQILKNQEKIMATLADVKAAADAQTTVIDSVVALLTSLSDKIANLEPNQQAIDDLAAEIAAQTQELASAVTANTPAA